MSAATSYGHPSHRLWPASCQFQTRAGAAKDLRLFDDLVGEGQNFVRDCETERFGSLHVNNQLNLRRLLHRRFCGLLAFQDATNIDTCLTVRVRDARSVAQQPARRSNLVPIIDRRDCKARRQRYDLVAAGGEEWIGRLDEEPLD